MPLPEPLDEQRARAAMELLGRLLDGTARVADGPFDVQLLIDPAMPANEIRLVTTRETLTITLSASAPAAAGPDRPVA